MDQKKNEITNIPLPSIRRLPAYLQVLHKQKEQGQEWTSTTDLAEKLHLKAIQVRKDMGSCGCIGRPKKGFNTTESIEIIEHILGIENMNEAVLIGVGDLGSALLKYPGFIQSGIRISAAFESDTRMSGKKINSIPIYSSEAMENFIFRTATRFAILTVPAPAAQPVADKLVSAGILGIWNFSAAYLKVPSHVTVRREDLAIHLAALAAEVHHKQR